MSDYSDQPEPITPTEVDPELLAIGESLRNIRRQKGLTLRDVESESSGRWKAVVVGSYERGDRALTLKRAVGLAKFYEVPLDELLGLQKLSRSKAVGLTFKLSAFRAKERTLPAVFVRYFKEICRKRSDWNGEILSIRASDVMALSIILDMSEERLHSWLREEELLWN